MSHPRHLTRRALVAAVPAAALAPALAGRPRAAVARAVQSTQEAPSGGIGLARAEWESVYGAGEPVEVIDPVYDALTAHGTQIGWIYAGYADAKPGGESGAPVTFVEIAWDAGVPLDDALAAAESFLPADAAMTGSPFIDPPTPGGPITLDIRRYESAWLAGVPYAAGLDTTLNPGILVALHATATPSPPAPNP